MQAYSNSKRENDPHALPDVEVFELTAVEVAANMEDEVHEFMRERPEFRLAGMNSKVREQMLDAMVAELGIKGGWYWWSCFPGCLPDSDPMGPFATKAEALADAQSNSDDMED